MNYRVPIADLFAQYRSLKFELDKAIGNVISKSQFIRGEQVECFEEEFAQLFGMPNCVSCANGTDALFSNKKLGNKKW